MNDIEFIEQNCESFNISYNGLVYSVDLITLEQVIIQIEHRQLNIALSRVREQIEVINEMEKN